MELKKETKSFIDYLREHAYFRMSLAIHHFDDYDIVEIFDETGTLIGKEQINASGSDLLR